jgi:hypothetical protein
LPKLSNRHIGKLLRVDESTLRADAAENSAPDKKKSNEAKGGSVPPAGNSAPGLSGAAAAAAVASKENKGQRQAAKDQKRAEDVTRILSLATVTGKFPSLERWAKDILVRV